jgi:hypothetical protein
MLILGWRVLLFLPLTLGLAYLAREGGVDHVL